MRVLVSAEAERDLAAIADYIAADNPERAVNFLQEMREKCLGLSEMPERFPVVSRYESVGVRRRLHGRYLIFYRVDGDAVIILHILHGAQEYDVILFPS